MKKKTTTKKKLGRHRVLLSFVVVVYAVLQGKFPAHPGGEGIMTGLLSGEEEVRAESQQSLLHRFTYRLLALDFRVRMMGEPHLSSVTDRKSGSDFFNNLGST